MTQKITAKHSCHQVYFHFMQMLLFEFEHICIVPTPCMSLLVVNYTFIVLLALVSVSEEVRSRCHLKHRTAHYILTDSPSTESLNSDLASSQGAYISPTLSTSTSISSSASGTLGLTIALFCFFTN